MADETVGLMCCGGEAGAAWGDELARAGLAVRLVRRPAEAAGLRVLMVHARDADGARDALREVTGRAESATPVLVVLDAGDSSDRAAMLESGADDCVTEPVSPRELGARIGRLIGMADMARETARHSAVLSREMAHARRVQRHILPLEPPHVDGVQIVAEYVPATDIGGDLFDIIPLEPGRVAFFMADVAGHGIGAALNTMVIKSQLSIWGKPGITVTETLGMLNNHLFALTDLDYATAVYAILDVPSRQLEYAVAGHPNPLLLRRDEAVRMLEVSRLPASSSGFRAGLPLGLFEDGIYVSERVQLVPHDRVLLFTDGVIEWRDGEDNLLGMEGLRTLLEASGGQPLKAQVPWVLDQLKSLSPGQPPADDVNLLAFEVE